jgi:hypothetical protein
MGAAYRSRAGKDSGNPSRLTVPENLLFSALMGFLPRECRRRLLLAASLVVPLQGCRSWDEIRAGYIEPLNDFLHKRYARVWETEELDAVLSLYSAELAGDERFRREKRLLLERFTAIEQAFAIIDRLEQAGRAAVVDAGVLLRLRGIAEGGVRLALERYYVLRCARGAAGEWEIISEELRGEEAVAGHSTSFSEESAERGLEFTHSSRGVPDKFGTVQLYSPGSGLAVGDYDGDGDEDVLLVAGDGAYLYANHGGKLVEATVASGLGPFPLDGLENRGGEGRCAVFADYDNDGELDLFAGRIDAPDLLYRNLGGGRFEEVGARAGIVAADGVFETTGACFADFDADGHLDLYVVQGGNLLRKHPDPMYNALDAAPNRFYLSRGDGTFSDRTAESGTGHRGWALAVSAADYDLDGDIDIFVGNDVGFNVLYRNRGDAVFDDVTLEAGLIYRGTSMSASWGDINEDGYPDLFVAAMDSNSRWMIDQPGFPAPAPWFLNLFIRSLVLDILREMLHGNRVYVSQGDGTFRDISSTSGLRRNGWAWSSLFLDHDNDGLLDVSSVNGFISGEVKDDL